MPILILNLGSTSFKYELFDKANLESLQKGEYEITSDKQLTISDNALFQQEIDRLFRDVLRQIGNVSEIKAVGHRVVHGGDRYIQTQEIDSGEIAELEKLNNLAPAHNPYDLAGIKSSNKYLPEVKDYAVFDTAFFKDLPDFSKIYPIPYEYYEKFGIKKFGFHGTSHKYAGEEAAKKIRKPFDKCNLITVHLGGGCSVCAISHGKPVDTSMGFTPLEGLMMQTRCGDVDEGVVLEILNTLIDPDKTRIDTGGQNMQDVINEVRQILNYESGIKGISGHSDYLELLKAVSWGDAKSKLAFEMFIHRIKKYIGAYVAILGDVDALVFTGKIGAGSALTRKKICDKMKILENVGKVLVEPNEELAIAREVKNAI